MLERICSQCNNIIFYKSQSGYKNAIKNNSLCRKCVSINNGFLERYATKGKNTKEKNAFFGKKHSKEIRNKMSESAKNRDQSKYKSKEFKEKISKHSSGKNNPMYGKNFYNIWIEKYGKDEADKRLKNFKEKQSKNNSGSKNNMYGKPSPNGSGNGWKGWYKNFYFRSLRELTYILECEKNNIKLKSAENIRIKYICPMGKNKTYSPDFLIDNKLIEIKPIRLHNTPLIQAKKNAGIKYAKENNLIYEIIDVEINKNLINEYINDIKFDRNYKERYEKWIIKDKN